MGVSIPAGKNSRRSTTATRARSATIAFQRVVRLDRGRNALDLDHLSSRVSGNLVAFLVNDPRLSIESRNGNGTWVINQGVGNNETRNGTRLGLMAPPGWFARGKQAIVNRRRGGGARHATAPRIAAPSCSSAGSRSWRLPAADHAKRHHSI